MKIECKECGWTCTKSTEMETEIAFDAHCKEKHDTSHMTMDELLAKIKENAK